MPAHRPPARRDRPLDGAVDALGQTQPRGLRRRRRACGQARRCSASSRARSTSSCARGRPQALTAIGFDGYAIGGLAVGEGQEAMFATLDFAAGAVARRCAALPDGRRQARRPRRRGRRAGSTCSTACCRPARAATARRSPGAARSTCATPATPRTPRRSTSAARARPAPIIRAPTCTTWSRPAKFSAAMLVTEHNLTFYQQLMQALREAIATGTLATFAALFRRNYCAAGANT